MAKYELIALEEYSSVHEIEANSFEEAREKLENNVNSGELVLECAYYNYNRKWKNNYSKVLNEPLKISASFNPEKSLLTISHNNKSADYTCDDVADLIHDISLYCNSFLEDREITKESLENNKIALRNNFNFFPVDSNNIDFFDKLVKTNDKVKLNDNEILDVYCAIDYDSVLLVDDFFGNNNGYSMEDYIIKNENELEI